MTILFESNGNRFGSSVFVSLEGIHVYKSVILHLFKIDIQNQLVFLVFLDQWDYLDFKYCYRMANGNQNK